MKKTINIILILVILFQFTITGYGAGAVTKYKVEFNSNGGGNISSQEVESGGKLIRPKDPVRKGYDFQGWYKDREFKNKYDFNNPVTGSFTLYAKWEASINYTVKFDSKGGTPIADQKVKKGDKLKKPSNPKKSGYIFKTWKDLRDNKDFDFNRQIDRDYNLYASWDRLDTSAPNDDKDRKKYKVEFDSRGGSSVPSQEVAYGERVLEPEDPEKSGYTFDGWYKDSRLRKSFRFSTKIYGNQTLYAKWEKDADDTYRVRFDSYGGTEIDDIKVEKGKKLKKPKDPFKPGYIFEGWYTDDDFKDRHKFDFKEEVYDDMTLYADWDYDDDVVKLDFLVIDNNGKTIMDERDYYVNKGLNIMKISEEALGRKNKYLDKGKTKEEKAFDKDNAVTFKKSGKTFTAINGLENQTNLKWTLYFNGRKIEEDEVFKIKVRDRDEIRWVYGREYFNHSILGRDDPLIGKDKGIAYIGGYDDGSFRPNAFITREELAKIIYYLADDKYFENIYLEYNPYKDLYRFSWSYEYIISLNQLNLFTGFGIDEFRPKSYATRGEVAILLARAKALEPVNKNYFHDVTNYFGKKEVNAVAEKGWINGYGGGVFKPNEPITRAELVTVMNKALERKKGNNKPNKFKDVKPGSWYYEEVIKAI